MSAVPAQVAPNPLELIVQGVKSLIPARHTDARLSLSIYTLDAMERFILPHIRADVDGTLWPHIDAHTPRGCIGGVRVRLSRGIPDGTVLLTFNEAGVQRVRHFEVP